MMETLLLAAYICLFVSITEIIITGCQFGNILRKNDNNEDKCHNNKNNKNKNNNKNNKWLNLKDARGRCY